MIRTEILLAGFGFSSTNTIAMCNLCRDEITRDVRWHVENTFGSSFNTTGLGGVLTTGVTGIGAGLSHAPMKASGGEKERVVFFSFPHIAIDGDGSVGIVHRPWRCKPSHACGALEAALGHFKACNHDDHNKTSSLAWTTVDDNGKAIGMVDEMDPEFSFLIEEGAWPSDQERLSSCATIWRCLQRTRRSVSMMEMHRLARAFRVLASSPSLVHQIRHKNKAF